jgi:hypothetical protein
MIEQNESDAAADKHACERRKVPESKAGDRMSRSIDSLTFMFPGIDEEAVEAAEGREDDSNRQQRKAQVGTASDRGDKGGSSKAETHGDLLRQTTGNLPLSRCAASGMDEDKVPRDQPPENQVKANGCRIEVRKKSRKRNGGEKDSSEKTHVVAMVEVVAGFETRVPSRIDVEQAGIHQTIASIEHPDG